MTLQASESSQTDFFLDFIVCRLDCGMTCRPSYLVLVGSGGFKFRVGRPSSWNFWDIGTFRIVWSSTPTGSGVVIGQGGNGQQYLPNTNEAQFDNLIITPMSAGNNPQPRQHSGQVQLRFRLVNAGISETKVWNAIEFIQSGFLRLGGGSSLPNPGCEVINQSWVAA